jgi:hypothetical protein
MTGFEELDLYGSWDTVPDCCDLRQACGVGDRRKAVSFLSKDDA